LIRIGFFVFFSLLGFRTFFFSLGGGEAGSIETRGKMTAGAALEINEGPS